MAIPAGDRATLFRLVELMATKEQIENVLRAKQAPFSSPNKADLMQRRVTSALAEQRLSLDDLGALLSDCEEHGRQHVFLFRVPAQTAAPHFGMAAINRGLQRLGVPGILETPRVLDRPADQRFCEARLESTPNHQPKALVIKRVTTREVRRLAEEGPYGQGQYRLLYDIEEARSIDLVKLNANGSIEVRIQSHPRANYAREADNVLVGLTAAGLMPTGWRRVPLTRLRRNLFERRDDIADEVWFSASRVRTREGNVVTAATGEITANLFDDQASANSLGAALADGTFDESDVWILGGNDRAGEPVFVHVIISGAEHEFALTAQATMAQYENVLSTIRKYA